MYNTKLNFSPFGIMYGLIVTNVTLFFYFGMMQSFGGGGNVFSKDVVEGYTALLLWGGPVSPRAVHLCMSLLRFVFLRCAPGW